MPYVGRGLTTGAQYQKLDAIAINNATTFTMSVGSVNVSPDQNHLILVVNGVIQEPGTGFTVAGSTCTLASAITTSGHSGTDTIYGVIAGDAAFAAYDSIGANALGVTAGTVTASRAIVPDSNKDIASFRNVTLTGELDAATLDISGNADIDGTTNLDAVDIDGAVQVDNTITVGADDQGYDVKFFGDTASAYMLWDTSADDLVFAGAAGIDLAGDLDVDGTTNLDAVDIDGAVNMAADLTSTADVIIDSDTKGLVLGDDQDVTLFSDAAGKVNIVRGTDVTPAAGDTEGWMELVVGDSAASSIKIVGGEGGGTGLYLYEDGGDDNDDHWAITTGSGSFKIDNYSTGSWVTDLAITSAGLMGIGTASPDSDSLLHLKKSSGFTQLRLETDDTSTNVDFTEIYLDADDGGDNQVWRIQGIGGSHASMARKLAIYDGTDSEYRLVIDGSGNVGIGDSSPDSRLHITDAYGNAPLVTMELTGGGGKLISFITNGSENGYIQEAAGNVTLVAFTGAHASQTADEDTNIAVGSVISTIDEEFKPNHPKTKISDVENDTRVYGVLQNYEEGESSFVVASVGIGSIRVTGSCSGGDLLVSNGDGTAKVDNNATLQTCIGKVTMVNSSEEVKLVSCVLYCG